MSRLERIVIAYPSGNATALLFDARQHEDRRALNAGILRAWKAQTDHHVQIEQCCFVTRPHSPEAYTRIEMFGGEFCANAARSAAWLACGGVDGDGLLEVSGVRRPLHFRVRDGRVAVEMPMPPALNLVTPVEEGFVVRLDGIAHLVVDSEWGDIRSAAALVSELAHHGKYGLEQQPAVGVSRYDRRSGAADFHVWVKRVGTLFDETACGSGTSAIGIAAAAAAQETVTLTVAQPSGESITSEATYSAMLGSVVSSAIDGAVTVIYDGPLDLG
jgi:histidine racemase